MRSVQVFVATVCLVAAAAARADGELGPIAVKPAAQSFHVGALELTTLKDAAMRVPNDGKTFGIDATTDDVAQLLQAAGTPTGHLTLAVDVLMVKTAGRVVLLDSGLGPMAHGVLLDSLKLAGVAPEAVTDVLITHSHGDHVGGLVSATGQPAFPKASIHMATAEWTWLQKQGPAPLVKAIADQVHTFEPGATVVPGITSRAQAGHTPGHVGYEISSGAAHLLDIGDLAHSSIVSLEKPQWMMGFDTDQNVAKATRVRELAELAGSHALVYAPHFPFPGVGHIVADGAGFKWQPGVP